MITLTVKMDEDDDDRINCHQSCSALEMMVATNLGGSELVNKYIRSWMEAQENSGSPNINIIKLSMILPHVIISLLHDHVDSTHTNSGRDPLEVH